MEDELALAMPAFLDPSEHVDIPEQELEHILEDDMLERAESSDLLNWTSDERTFPVQDGRPISGHHWVTPGSYCIDSKFVLYPVFRMQFSRQ